jgi:integrase
MQLNRIEVDGNYYYLPQGKELFRAAPVLKTPEKGDWYIYYHIWDFDNGKWLPQKYYSKILNKKEHISNTRLRKKNGEGIRIAVATQLSIGVDPKTGVAISPLVDKPIEELLSQANDPSPIPTLEKAIEQWLKIKAGKDNPSKAAPENKENTEGTYNSLFNLFKEFCREQDCLTARLDKITKNTILQFFEERYTSGTIKDTTWNNQLGSIRAMFAYYARRYDYKDISITIDRKESVEDSERFEPFSTVQLKKILEYFDQARVIARVVPGKAYISNKLMAYICRTIFYTFIRISELRRIKIKNVKRYKEGYFSLSVGSTKTKKKIFTELYLDPALVAEFEKLGWEQYFDDKKYDNYYVFTSDMIPSLKRADRSGLSTRFKAALEDLNIYNDGKHSLYSLKATGNIEAFKAGWDLFQISIQNRHTTTIQTETYLRKLKCDIASRPRPPRVVY